MKISCNEDSLLSRLRAHIIFSRHKQAKYDVQEQRAEQPWREDGTVPALRPNGVAMIRGTGGFAFDLHPALTMMYV